jgi:hypothetical protein
MAAAQCSAVEHSTFPASAQYFRQACFVPPPGAPLFVAALRIPRGQQRNSAQTLLPIPIPKAPLESATFWNVTMSCPRLPLLEDPLYESRATTPLPF